jgi:outer membrane protein assembly factor BamE (lipoprotein component of BamABCDE complex)
MKKFIAMFMAAAVLAGCASSGNQVLKGETAETVSTKITKGVSTKDNVRKAYGDPTNTSFTDGGNEIWTYNYAHATATAVSYVPIVGLFAGGADVDKKQLVILFDKAGVVSNFTMQASKEELKRGTTE